MYKTYKEALQNVFIFENTRDYSLEKVQKAYELLWSPLEQIKIIHITWTNGKWSTSQMLFSILKESWKTVWIFTSPHLIDIKERFNTQDWEITEKEFLFCVNRILELPIELSYFEKCTLIAFLFFHKRQVEYAIVEVWFWWLLDSTNVVSPIITAITSIWLDHTDYLWDTLEKISYQKSGIIKEGIPIVINHKNIIIEQTAKAKNAELIFTNQKIQTNLLWDHQKNNAGIAFEIAKKIGIQKKYILKWLQRVKHFWRLQYVTDNLIIDGAHNEDWLNALKKYIDSIIKKYEKVYYCFSLKKGKNIEWIVEKFWDKQNYIIVKNDSNILEKAERLKEQMSWQWINSEVNSTEDIFKKSKKEKQSLFIVFWSLYLIGDFL